jgi:hypothetical protein
MNSGPISPIIGNVLSGAPAAIGGGSLDILLQLARLGVAGLAIYILYLGHNLYRQANSEGTPAVIAARQKGAAKYLTSSYVLVAICALVEVLRLFGPNPAMGPVKARIGVAGWREARSEQYGKPTIWLLHGQDEIPVPATTNPKEISVNHSDQINVDLDSMTNSYDKLAADHMKTRDELIQQRNTVRTTVLPPSDTQEPTAID